MTEEEYLAPEQLAVYFTLMEVGQLLQYKVEQQLREDGDISGVQFKILAGLNAIEGGRQRLTDVADRIVYSRSGITYQAKELDKRGLIKRLADPDDERSTIIAITSRGRALVRRVLPAHQQVVRGQFLDHLIAKDAATLQRILGGVRDQMRTAPPRSATPRSAKPRSVKPRPGAFSQTPR